MKSMTGFGKSEIAIDGRKLRIEIKTVNHRFLDISVRQPRFLMQMEEYIRKCVKERLARGRVELFINYASERDDSKKVVVDLPLITAYKDAARRIAEATGVEDDLTAARLMRLPDAVNYEEEEMTEEMLKELVDVNLTHALDELIAARTREGAELKKDIVYRLNLLIELAQSIKSREHTVVADYKKRLEDRMAELLDGAEVDAQRIAQEVAFYADRCNITEELVRIQSHVQHFLDSTTQDGAQGRNMDFIVQELNREFNTIGSKSQDQDITQAVIVAKGEIEKIREQIQNIE